MTKKEVRKISELRNKNLSWRQIVKKLGILKSPCSVRENYKNYKKRFDDAEEIAENRKFSIFVVGASPKALAKMRKKYKVTTPNF